MCILKFFYFLLVCKKMWHGSKTAEYLKIDQSMKKQRCHIRQTCSILNNQLNHVHELHLKECFVICLSISVVYLHDSIWCCRVVNVKSMINSALRKKRHLGAALYQRKTEISQHIV